MIVYRIMSVSVPSFGDSFFMALISRLRSFSSADCFRPLIRGFFFYEIRAATKELMKKGFRPLIRGFFFYGKFNSRKNLPTTEFPSPHSGILFL